MRSLERAIAFCQSTLSYGKAQEAPPDRRMVQVEPVVREVRESAGVGSDTSIEWINAIERGLTVDADPDQLFRVLLNLVRNAAQALESEKYNGESDVFTMCADKIKELDVELGLIKISLDYKNMLLASCEAALDGRNP